MSRPLAILGGGGFGLSLARAAAAAGTPVILWSRREQPGGDGIVVTDDLARAAAPDLIVLAVPSAHAPELLARLGPRLDGRHRVVHVSRGLVPGESGRPETIGEAIARITAVRRVGVLAGPLVPGDLADRKPSGGVVGTEYPEIVGALREALGGASTRLRLYGSRDRLGVELASALCGALLFTIGYARGIGVGPSGIATLVTRGLSEATRLGCAMGAEASTFAGLSGLGDLVAAVAGAGRPEVALGEAIAAGTSMRAALPALGAHVESAAVARLLVAHADRIGVDVPIARATAGMLAGTLTGPEAVEQLMGRRPRDE